MKGSRFWRELFRAYWCTRCWGIPQQQISNQTKWQTLFLWVAVKLIIKRI